MLKIHSTQTPSANLFFGETHLIRWNYSFWKWRILRMGIMDGRDRRRRSRLCIFHMFLHLLFYMAFPKHTCLITAAINWTKHMSNHFIRGRNTFLTIGHQLLMRLWSAYRPHGSLYKSLVVDSYHHLVQFWMRQSQLIHFSYLCPFFKPIKSRTM